MAMIMGALTWLQNNRRNFEKMYENKEQKTQRILNKEEKKSSELVTETPKSLKPSPNDPKTPQNEPKSKKKPIRELPKWLLKSSKKTKKQSYCAARKKLDLEFEKEFDTLITNPRKLGKNFCQF